jgi:hypothetical protein
MRIRLTDVMHDEPQVHKALNNLAVHISERHKQCPAIAHSERSKVDYLANAVEGHSWATPCIARVTENMTFQQLLMDLFRIVKASVMKMEKKSQSLEARRSKHTISELGHKPATKLNQPRYSRNSRIGHKTDSVTVPKHSGINFI